MTVSQLADNSAPGEGLQVDVVKPSGCLLVFGGLASFGVVPVVILFPRRRWPRLLDESGMTLRNGTHIPLE